ncbi:flagellar type III secretion system pore protein FliP [Notoacmeibacter sp. MSK16QG-6]|uniref:flagellar type III secretion system pore protein FliP n=1 Tax=Notoacmeibacter sp. MSK16QG-6 TaxID=2957982 RepID=UPI00209E2ECF|nr:flagellar type III secretion system pore protein FliP [Notoacmeibacter sp. MSK16QG-6]MCP1200922.1 flagellar type III secretion system pore protein FliP [Notoacmeibacter sp. MSK16QG-6]
MRCRAALPILLGAMALLFMAGGPANAQSLQLPAFLEPGETADGQTAGYIVQLFGLLTVLSLAPGILISVTSFTRFIVVFSIMRSGLGLQTTPANLILVSLALFMTWYVMSPVVDRAWNDGLGPMMRNEIGQEEGFQRTAEPFRQFMLANVRDSDLRLFADLSPALVVGEDDAPARPNTPSPAPGSPRTDGDNPLIGVGAEIQPIADGAEANETGEEAVAYSILIPAFMISELRRGFEIGFLVVLPFLVIDLVVSTITMAMGMMMLPPTVLSLPLKVLFFVLIDGWNLLVGSMVRSFT